MLAVNFSWGQTNIDGSPTTGQVTILTSSEHWTRHVSITIVEAATMVFIVFTMLMMEEQDSNKPGLLSCYCLVSLDKQRAKWVQEKFNKELDRLTDTYLVWNISDKIQMT